MRTFSLLFAFIALVMLAMFVIYVVRGPVDPLIAAGIFVSFLACLAPALLLLKPFEPPEAAAAPQGGGPQGARGAPAF